MDNNEKLLHGMVMWRWLFILLYSYWDYFRVTLKLLAQPAYVIEQSEDMIPERHLNHKCHVVKILNVT